MMIKRLVTQQILTEIDAREYIAIVGPRQAGKTTLLKILQKTLLRSDKISSNQVVFETFQDPLLVQEFVENPVQFIKNRQAIGKKTFFFIDEFQMAEKAGAKLKLIYDTVENVKITVTGSSSLQIRNIASEMVGRIFQYNLNTFTLPEVTTTLPYPAQKEFLTQQEYIHAFFNEAHKAPQVVREPMQSYQRHIRLLVDQIMIYGSYPAVFTEQDTGKKITRLLNIYNTYVEKDILRLLQIGKTNQYLHFVQYLALHIGQLHRNQSVQDELNLSYDTVREFIEALEQTYIIQGLRPYFTNKAKELKKSSIYYFNDLGIRNWSIQNFNELDSRGDAGFMLENYIVRRLNDFFQYNNMHRYQFKYWRKTSGAEVDIVIQKPNGDLMPIEVKFRSMKTPVVGKSFYSFIDDYCPTHGIIITKDFLSVQPVRSTQVLFLPYYLL